MIRMLNSKGNFKPFVEKRKATRGLKTLKNWVLRWNFYYYFTSAAFGGASGQTGTVLKFNAPTGQDSMLKNGVTSSISTRHQCITAMKEYENKSLEVSDGCISSYNLG